ncbi:E3 ubiquitin-protein ligase pub1 [Coemansia sp. RSA 1286]|nr:E3 ubiquitin-protein ligase pub1 [Coemansia sp. RSA 1721]KAJ2640015.1 E3 ubiquitin-protein ligase pub1 [Coemansia sp. RSA 1286]
MMEGQTAATSANSVPANGIYAPNPQQQQPSPINGSSVQYAPGMLTTQKTDDPSAKSLYVGNLDPRVNEAVLYEVFGSVRPVVSAKIIPDKRQANGGLNYGFIEFESHQDAEYVLQNTNGRRVFDCEIRVNWAFANGGQLQEDTSNHFPIFVGDLSAEVNDQVLAKAFSVYPSMSDARVMWDMTSGKSRGFGFVAFRDRADAENAIAQMNGEWLGSRAIRVNWANQKATAKARQDGQNGAHHQQQQQQQHQQQPPAPLTYEGVRDMTAHFNTTVYVGNMTNYTTQEQLQVLFQPFGFVVEVRMQPERGFAFVKMDSHENATMAIVQLNGTAVNGRPIKCSWGKDRVTDPKAAFGALAAQVAANPAYTYPYVYGIPPQQQYGVPPNGAGAQQGQQQGQQQQPWGNFGYESYGYYGNPNYPQPGQMIPQQNALGTTGAPASVPNASQALPEGSY